MQTVRSGDVAKLVKKTATQVSPVRDGLLRDLEVTVSCMSDLAKGMEASLKRYDD